MIRNDRGYTMCRCSDWQVYCHHINCLSTITYQSVLSVFLSMIFRCQRHWRWWGLQQMLPSDLRKHGGGARCLDDLTTLGPADVAMMEMSTGRGNWSSGMRGLHFSRFFVSVFTPKAGQYWKAGKDGGWREREICKHRGDRKRRRPREDWSVALTVVTDVEFSTKLCQEPSCQS